MQSASVDAERRSVVDAARGALLIVGHVVSLAFVWLDVVAPSTILRQHRAGFTRAHGAWPRIRHAADRRMRELGGFITAARALSGFDLGSGELSCRRLLARFLLFLCHLRIVSLKKILREARRAMEAASPSVVAVVLSPRLSRLVWALVRAVKAGVRGGRRRAEQQQPDPRAPPLHRGRRRGCQHECVARACGGRRAVSRRLPHTSGTC